MGHTVKNLPAMCEDPLKERMAPHSGILASTCICMYEYMQRVFLEDLYKQ